MNNRSKLMINKKTMGLKSNSNIVKSSMKNMSKNSMARLSQTSNKSPVNLKSVARDSHNSLAS